MMSPVDALHLYVKGWLSGSVATTDIVETVPTVKLAGFADRL
jgi:hypothetical protein